MNNIKQGKLIGWKKVKTYHKGKRKWWLVKLEIPADAKRVSPFGDKCRATHAKVLKIYELTGFQREQREKHIKPTNRKSVTNLGMASEAVNHPTQYRIGRIVRAHNWFDTHNYLECAAGIHFFMVKRKALRY